MEYAFLGSKAPLEEESQRIVSSQILTQLREIALMHIFKGIAIWGTQRRELKSHIPLENPYLTSRLFPSLSLPRH